jgi:hypothetical protein
LFDVIDASMFYKKIYLWSFVINHLSKNSSLEEKYCLAINSYRNGLYNGEVERKSKQDEGLKYLKEDCYTIIYNPYIILCFLCF